MIKRPEYIKKGDTIGITAPSFGASTEPYSLMFDVSLGKIKDRGYKILEGETARKGDGLGISTDPKVCAKELVKFYKNSDCQAIISAGGGELMCETVSNIDFEELKAYKPKWFMGYSDNTNFVFPLVTITGVQGIYGPCISNFSKIWETPEEDAFAILEGTKSSFEGYDQFVDPVNDVKVTDYTNYSFEKKYRYDTPKVLSSFTPSNGVLVKASEDQEVAFNGVLLGGCLDILVNIAGTRFDNMKEFNAQNKDVVWVIECCELNPMAIRRSMWCLKEAGWFDSAKGFVIGRPELAYHQNFMGVDRINAVTDPLKELGVPVIMDADIGHIDPMLPVIMGADARVSALGNRFRIEY
ncbi:S66 family peptidase [Butyrivibrio proteoclasticus]|uniref:S66 family peptidase n=1 Tax=Butyrivibrio proteoclasticus TaxID=43305 RepID=UPI0009DF3A7B|nr:S66 peptidase family protein [Butyrivibrio proteoclasticus]